MTALPITEAAARHAGLVMAHAAVVASVLEPGELICPFAVVAKGDDRQSIEFESDTQDQAVERAWASLDEYRNQIDLWAMAREGSVAGPDGKEDVVVVATWGQGMAEPFVFTQRFRPKAKGVFALLGPTSVQQQFQDSELGQLRAWFEAGISSHPKHDRWSAWRNAGAQQAVPADIARPAGERRG